MQNISWYLKIIYLFIYLFKIILKEIKLICKTEWLKPEKVNLNNYKNNNFNEGEELAANYGISFFETSAKDGLNITETF